MEAKHVTRSLNCECRAFGRVYAPDNAPSVHCIPARCPRDPQPPVTPLLHQFPTSPDSPDFKSLCLMLILLECAADQASL